MHQWWSRVQGLACKENLRTSLRSRRAWRPPRCLHRPRQFFIDNLLVQIYHIFVMIKWTGIAPREFEFPSPGSLTPCFLKEGHITSPRYKAANGHPPFPMNQRNQQREGPHRGGSSTPTSRECCCSTLLEGFAVSGHRSGLRNVGSYGGEIGSKAKQRAFLRA